MRLRKSASAAGTFTPAAYAPYAVTESFFVEKFNIGKSRNILFCKRSSGKYFNVSRF